MKNPFIEQVIVTLVSRKNNDFEAIAHRRQKPVIGMKRKTWREHD